MKMAGPDALAFNQGSDARLAGKPLAANPYRPHGETSSAWHRWKQGWFDVDRHWGENAGSRPVRPLPEVREVA